jgi:hypothetical protein
LYLSPRLETLLNLPTAIFDLNSHLMFNGRLSSPQQGTALLKGENWRSLIWFLLVFSTIGFVLLLTLLILNSSLLYLGAGYVELYSAAVLMIVLLFPLSLGLTLSSKGMISFPIVVLLAAIFVGALFILVPVVAVQKPYPEHCLGSYPEWQSISYHLFGVGSHFDLIGCA